ncbi:MAG TPA: DPP IV N-terminal domain-containing protein [Anaerolineales bacterium]|nr:DPP IV N-terminal domain-containing protein [Anaerolineales bacterium]
MKTTMRAILLLALLAALAGCIPSSGNGSNGMIVFQSDRDGNYDLYVMNPDGTDVRNLTNHPASDTGPVPSPDGRRIAFQSNRDGNNEIYVVDLETGKQTNLTNHTASDHSPTWSPDGSSIAFVSDRDALLLDEARGLWTNDIYIMNSDGSDQRRLTADNLTNGYGGLAWSPDGGSIALCLSSFTAYGGYFPLGIHLLDLDDLILTRLTFDSATIQCDPKWSPDGNQILYEVSGSGFSNLYLMNADGTDQNNVSTDPATYDTTPSWSADGKSIVFASDRGDGYHLYVMSADGSNLILLTNGPGEEAFPVWLP